MMEKKKNVPVLRFPEFSGDWEKKKLGNVFSIFNGFAFSSKEAKEEGVKWVKIADVGIQEMKKDNISYLPDCYSNTHNKFILNKGDYVIALTRPILNGQLKIAQINDFFDNSLLNQRVGKIESKNILGFIYFLLQKEELIKSIANSIAGSDPPNLSPNEINSIELIIPDVCEQQKLASFLMTVDDKLQTLKKNKTLLEQYKKGMMQKIFSHELCFKDDNRIEYPKWKTMKLGNSVEIKKGQQLNVTELFDEGIYPALNGGINPSGYTDKWNTDANTISISEGGNSCGYVNFNKKKFWSGGHCYTILNISPLINSSFLFQILKYNEILIMRLRVGSGLPNIQKKDLNELILNIPIIEEQTKIANFLSAIDDKINLCNTQIEKTEHWKKGLLQKMFV